MLLWCGSHLQTSSGDNSFMQEQTVSLVCYSHKLSSHTLTFHVFYTINLHLLSQTEDFLLNNRTDNDTFQHNWIINVSPSSVPQSLSLSTVVGWGNVSHQSTIEQVFAVCKEKGKEREESEPLCISGLKPFVLSYSQLPLLRISPLHCGWTRGMDQDNQSLKLLITFYDINHIFVCLGGLHVEWIHH